MTRTINNLKFRVHSPSLFELLNLDTRDVRVVVMYHDGAWMVVYHDLVAGRTISRLFTTRDEAIGLLASRR